MQKDQLAMAQLVFVSEFVLLRRVETMQKVLEAGDLAKFDKVVSATLQIISNNKESDVHELNIRAYVNHIELAQLLVYVGVISGALEHVALAEDVLVRDLATMTPAYILANRMFKGDTEKDIGSLYDLPNDIMNNIAKLVESR